MNNVVGQLNFKVVFAKKKLAGPMNNARDPPFFNKTLEGMENVRFKRTLNISPLQPAPQVIIPAYALGALAQFHHMLDSQII